MDCGTGLSYGRMQLTRNRERGRKEAMCLAEDRAVGVFRADERRRQILNLQGGFTLQAEVLQL